MSSVQSNFNVSSEEWPALPSSIGRAGQTNYQPASNVMSMDIDNSASIPVVLTSRPPAVVYTGKPSLSPAKVAAAGHQPHLLLLTLKLFHKIKSIVKQKLTM
jgi:hypothetical protein